MHVGRGNTVADPVQLCRVKVSMLSKILYSYVGLKFLCYQLNFDLKRVI